MTNKKLYRKADALLFGENPMKKILILTILTFLLSSFTAREIPCNKDVLSLSRQVLVAQLGTRELTNRNDGTRVESYLSSVGLPKGNPYCIAIQYYCFDEAVNVLGLPKSEIPIIKTGSSQYLYNWAIDNGKKASLNPRVNDILIWRTGKTNSGHGGRVIAVGKGGWVTTIEGNTSSDAKGNQRDGGGVYEKKRNIFHPLGRMKLRGIIHFKDV